jgi:glutathione S-transferase
MDETLAGRLSMATDAVETIRLFELALEDGRSASPFVWRIRYALAHKGLSCEAVQLGFTAIPKAFGGRFKTVPVIEHGTTLMAESWDIAEYLDRAFPDRPRLFSGPAEIAMVRLMDAWFTSEIMRKMFRLYVKDVHDAAHPQDRDYFRQSREKNMKGETLESFTAERASHLPALRTSLAPLRTHLAKFAFLGGDIPNYADYIALSAFHWAASVATLPLLAPDDTLRGWLDRGFALYGGIGQNARINPLFAQA